MSILANRYASDEMKDIWSPRSKIIAERKTLDYCVEDSERAWL